MERLWSAPCPRGLNLGCRLLTASLFKLAGDVGRTADVEWRINPLQVDTSLLDKILQVIPLEAALADQAHAPLFLDWCEGLAKWTIERIAPAWARSRRDLDDYHGPNYFKWRRHLYRFLARVSLMLPVEEGTRRFLQPAMDTNDEAFASLGEWFTVHLIAQVADSPEIPQIALDLLSVVTQRVLTYRTGAMSVKAGSQSKTSSTSSSTCSSRILGTQVGPFALRMETGPRLEL